MDIDRAQEVALSAGESAMTTMDTQAPDNDLRVVAVGGGTGMFTVLSGLTRLTSHLTAVVTMSDNRGSSGRLRDELGTLPSGDVRRCLVALADRQRSLILRQLFEYRFERGTGLSGHSFGDLLLAALGEILGAPERAIEEAGRLLGIRGQVLPVTLTDTTLHARLADGHVIHGETDIDIREVHQGAGIENVYLNPPARANERVIEAIERADMIVLGPANLYTGVIPNLLVDGVAEAIRSSTAMRVYVVNVMTKHAETDGYAASDFIRQVLRYLGTGPALDCAVINYHESLPHELLEKYKAEASEPVTIDLSACYDLVPHVFIRPLTTTGNYVRHDPALLADLLLEISTVARDPAENRGDPVAAG